MKLGGFSVTLGAVAALALLVVGASGTFAGPTPDSDGDNVKNLIDNCMTKSNPVNFQGIQTDYDRDGFGQECDGDLNQSGATNTTDFIIFGASFGEDCNFLEPGNACSNVDYNALADMNASGGVNTTDFVLFGANFLQGVPGPSGLLCAVNADSSATRFARYSDSLTGRHPCEYLGTYRLKCSGVIIMNHSTGENLRFIGNDELRPLEPGELGGHCVWGVTP
jgi:hypothetical protein